MTYVSPNFKTKAALKRAINGNEEVHVFEAGLGRLGSDGGIATVEGPHSPAPHTWYGKVEYDRSRRVTKVIE